MEVRYEEPVTHINETIEYVNSMSTWIRRNDSRSRAEGMHGNEDTSDDKRDEK